MSSSRAAFFSLIYIALVAGILMLFNVAWAYLLDNIIFRMLDWFNRLNFILQLLIFVVGGYVLVMIVLAFFAILVSLLSRLILDWFPVIALAVNLATLIAFANGIYNTILLWRAAPKFDLWIIFELCVLTYFVVKLNVTLVIKEKKVTGYENY
jgi:hypothetical protein